MSRRQLSRALAVALLTLFAGVAAAPARAAEVKVAAAASLTNALTELAKAWESQSGHTVTLNFGASNLLARQIAEGAPADVFFSADERQMDRLDHHEHMVLAATRRSLLSNTLVVVVPADSRLVIRRARDLAGPAIKVLALAEPQTVPAGIYAKQYLRSVGLWGQVIDRVVPTENVRGALAAVEAGNADAAIVYHSDAAISKKVRVAFDVPPAQGPKISYPVAVLAGADQRDAAKAFVDYLASPAAAEVFRRYGFLVPGAP
ncbi:MAG TPA: molybdate ABC transporter substrate-binding protein [Thermoanaerobaculia bacterium]|jgi:molybdate transport system substrate-binding protein|nr:molybdate ABC transporter substrate-binding protein [Thermoanaerobaculia bacterium]